MQSTVLIAILNWGLGHATRSMPIIDAFLSKNYNVHIASDGEAIAFLRKEYPDLVFHVLPGYDIAYTYKSILLNVIKAAIPILSAVYKEKRAINSIVAEINPDLIISDNRYGARSDLVKSILITHQLNIKLKNTFLSKLASGFVRYLINKFDEIWIPDYCDSNSLAGELSKVSENSKYVYIGPLSRLSPLNLKKQYDIAVVLSGPEPQRTNIEKIILKQFKRFDKKAIIVRGKVNEENDYLLNDNVEVKSYLLSDELNELLNRSDMVISRSGYSTIMDLVVLDKRAILIPTPGQTEQEYLAKYLMSKRFYYSCEQDDFDLDYALAKSKGFDGVKFEGINKMEEVISKV